MSRDSSGLCGETGGDPPRAVGARQVTGIRVFSTCIPANFSGFVGAGLHEVHWLFASSGRIGSVALIPPCCCKVPPS